MYKYCDVKTTIILEMQEATHALRDEGFDSARSLLRLGSTNYFSRGSFPSFEGGCNASGCVCD